MFTPSLGMLIYYHRIQWNVKMVGKVRDEKTGKYTVNPDKGVLLSVRVDQGDVESLKGMLAEGETISDKVREAIALYIRNNCS
ncbi:hypothetical protein ACX27_04100 [Nostoc piscinale CENA21]|uniref:Uncharacterized protein n=1 Tax=Nostoc piscinale CENA21 TaxID=224013 RepID=A0A0M5MGG1_9NOSO|nr:hypothetical protein ACX27_04100 [Nostoc piscinale CENA21]